MGSNSRQRTRVALIALTLGLWVAEYAGLTARGILMHIPYLGDLSFRRLLTCGFGALLCFGFGWIIDRLRRRSEALGVAGMLLLVLPATFTWAWVNTEVIMFARTNEGTSPATPLDFLNNVIVMGWIFGAFGAGWIAIQTNASLAEREVELARAAALITDTQNKMLRYQINPHFMFNTLSALSLMILQKRNETAERVVMNLAKFLRVSLEKSPQDRSRLSEEIEIQQQYLEIEKARFEDRLKVVIEAPSEAMDYFVPSFILQPLVENAIKYGVASTDQPVTITISAEAAGDALVLRVRDDGTAMTSTMPVTLGVGLSNVRDRLFLLYRDAAWLESGPLAEGGYLSTIRMPAERA